MTVYFFHLREKKDTFHQWLWPICWKKKKQLTKWSRMFVFSSFPPQHTHTSILLPRTMWNLSPRRRTTTMRLSQRWRSTPSSSSLEMTRYDHCAHYDGVAIVGSGASHEMLGILVRITNPFFGLCFKHGHSLGICLLKSIFLFSMNIWDCMRVSLLNWTSEISCTFIPSILIYCDAPVKYDDDSGNFGNPPLLF